MRSVQEVMRQLIRLEVDRAGFLLGVGGGVVCDITGFVASTYMRGIDFGFVPTTLLAQVDAAVGGKNGVNVDGYKNMVGVFNQPRFVLCDPEVLKTLPDAGIRSGLAEAVKSAAIGDSDMFAFLESDSGRIMNLESEALGRIVAGSLGVKTAIVNRDETESGERRLLNFGHTFGHAFERTGRLSHGEAVSMGMAAAADLSVHRGVLSREEADRLKGVLKTFNLPTRRQGDPARIWDALVKDKKRAGDMVKFVLLEEIGKPRIEDIPLNELEAFTHDLR